MPAPHHDWYMRDWLKHFSKKQADVMRALDWNKVKVSLMVAGKQQYTRDDVNALADYLNLRPYELLMHPDDAMALRRMRADALRIAHEAETAVEPEPNRTVSKN